MLAAVFSIAAAFGTLGGSGLAVGGSERATPSDGDDSGWTSIEADSGWAGTPPDSGWTVIQAQGAEDSGWTIGAPKDADA
ncbi:hypothetical protein [Streptomyces sp. KM273126]|uniref:hypothetical protein n=1 Tax=Streptomyces sp. KM273126 TaxID=2545247 RepID=UPI0028682960|nr:hypothetical protein [Streptomyces sp. KM273126]